MGMQPHDSDDKLCLKLKILDHEKLIHVLNTYKHPHTH
jgi:hypothetical protein